MAGFQAHLSASVLPAAGLATLSFAMETLSLIQAGAVFAVGAVGGFLPDLDADSGKPLAFLMQVVSVMVPSLVYVRVAPWVGASPEAVICYFAGFWLALRYGLFVLIKRATVHRGAMHSIPFALLCAGLAYLLFLPSAPQVALLAGIAVGLTSMGHLILDEVDAFEFKMGLIPVAKKSSGTALKLWSRSAGATLLLYSLVAVTYAAILTDGFQHIPKPGGW
ncbi:MAG: metal-dependent hydrolase [Desulfatibacillaceae bacterium]